MKLVEETLDLSVLMPAKEQLLPSNQAFGRTLCMLCRSAEDDMVKVVLTLLLRMCYQVSSCSLRCSMQF